MAKSLVSFFLTDILTTGGTSVTITDMISYNGGATSPASFTNETLVFENEDGSLRELAIGSASAGVLTLSYRGLDSSSTITEVTANKLEWRAGTKVYLTFAAFDAQGSYPSFGKVAVSGQTTVEADGTNDTLTLVAGTGMTITTTPASDSITITTTVEDQKDTANALNNLTIVASRSGSAETIALKTKAGADPSASDPIRIGFRNATAGNGTYTLVSIQSAVSITIPSTATMGASNSVPFRLWLVGFYDGSTFKLGLVNTQIANGIFSLQDGLASATAIDTASDNAGVIYGATAVTTQPMRLLGYLDYTLATVGTRNTVPSTIQIFGPGIKKPGDIIQIVSNYTGAVSTGSTTIPNDDTIPQNTEGNQYLSQAITPTSAPNILLVETLCVLSNSVSLELNAVALFQNSVASARAVATAQNPYAGAIVTIPLNYIATALTTSSTTFNVRIGANSGTVTFNGTGGLRRFGGALNSGIKITEFMA